MILAQFNAPPEPFHRPTLELFEPACLENLSLGFTDICVNRTVLYMLLTALVVIALFVAAAMRVRLVPRGVQNFVETIIAFVREQIVLQVIGHEGLRWVPFLTAMFMFILVGNILEVIPGVQFPINSRMAIPAFLAGVVWILFNVLGAKEQGIGGYLKNTLLPPGVPVAIKPLLALIEFVSVFIVRPFTLSVRLLANMIAGHLILAIFFLGTVYLLAKPITIPFGILSFGLSVGLVGFEILVSILQAYIFTILTAVYIAGAIHPEH